jgi:hypothetical protein
MDTNLINVKELTNSHLAKLGYTVKGLEESPPEKMTLLKKTNHGYRIYQGVKGPMRNIQREKDKIVYFEIEYDMYDSEGRIPMTAAFDIKENTFNQYSEFNRQNNTQSNEDLGDFYLQFELDQDRKNLDTIRGKKIKREEGVILTTATPDTLLGRASRALTRFDLNPNVHRLNPTATSVFDIVAQHHFGDSGSTRKRSRTEGHGRKKRNAKRRKTLKRKSKVQ